MLGGNKRDDVVGILKFIFAGRERRLGSGRSPFTIHRVAVRALGDVANVAHLASGLAGGLVERFAHGHACGTQVHVVVSVNFLIHINHYSEVVVTLDKFLRAGGRKGSGLHIALGIEIRS